MPNSIGILVRNVYLFMSLSLDGYFEGPNHDLSWINVDDEFNKFAIEQLKEADLELFGRRTYQLMEAWWPKVTQDPKASEEDLEIASLINNENKIVFSRTLDKVEEKDNWRNVKLVHEFDPEEVKRLKQLPGKGIGVGGSELAISLIRNGLIDEFRFMINPVVIGQGTPIFKGLNQKLNLELMNTRTFKSGNVLLSYRPA
jgi:dihydrofolate reductase